MTTKTQWARKVADSHTHKQNDAPRIKPWTSRALIDNGTIYVTIVMMVDIREYNDRGGHNLFGNGTTG